MKKSLQDWCIENDANDILNQWHKTLNLKTVKEVSYGSKFVAYWHCSRCNQVYTMPIQNKTTQKQGCPVCSNRKLVSGINDLQTKNFELAKEWNFEKNQLKPSEIFPNYTKKVWWTCARGHEWEATPNSRNTHGNGCPHCSSERRISFPEKAIFYYLKQKCPEVISGYKIPNTRNLELDIYLPTLLIGIEYDGSHFHKKTSRDKKKFETCKLHNIKLIRIREKECPKIKGIATASFQLSKDANADLDEAITFIFEYIAKNHQLSLMVPDINIKRDVANIYELYEIIEKKNSLAIKYPELAKQWHLTKNGKLTPEKIYPQSNTPIWWKCEQCGCEWQVSPNSRVGDKTGCPGCLGRILVKGVNDLQTKFPDLAKEWNFNKNKNLTPEMFSANSGKIVYWKCEKCKHEWKTGINKRTRDRTGCKVCLNLEVKQGYNDLSTTHPELAKQWDYDKNKNITPNEITYGTKREFWWICEKGHSFKVSPNDRTNKKSNCYYCSNKRVLLGYNDLKTKFPKIAGEWDYKKNEGLTPDMFVPGSGKVVSWKCKVCQKEWKTAIKSRTNGTGCPKCAQELRKISITKTRTKGRELSKINPELASEWDNLENGELTPNDVAAGSNKKVGWICKTCNHRWKATVQSRHCLKSGCPICAKRKIKILV